LLDVFVNPLVDHRDPARVDHLELPTIFKRNGGAFPERRGIEIVAVPTEKRCACSATLLRTMSTLLSM
jgi:hypothetical protein